MPEAPFEPAWWLPSGHLQTLWPTLLRRRRLPPGLARERIELPDGDFLDLDWAGPAGGPTVVILHGLEGSSRSPYARGMLAAVTRRGWRGVVMHFRGCGGEPNRLDRGYHSGETGDVAHVVDLVRDRTPGRPVAAVGFSLGGNVLVKWLGECGTSAPLAAAAAVCVPFDLGAVADRLERGLSRLYRDHLMRNMRRNLRRKFDGRPAPVDLERALAARGFREFDDAVTAPLHGFDGVEDYYRRAGSRPFLPEVRVPLLVVQARDDPFMTPRVIPDTAEISRSTTLEIHAGGGHVGFVSGPAPWRARYWLEERVPGFLARHLDGGPG